MEAASARLAGVPLVVPLGHHCAPSIVNDVLGHDESRPRMRTPFALGVFPPAEIARLLRDGLCARALVGRDVLVHADGSAPLFADDPTARKFGHDVIIRHKVYGNFCFNHDFLAEATDRVDGRRALVNHSWVYGMYEAKVSHLRAMLRLAPARGIVLCTVASPLQLGGCDVVPPTSLEIEVLARDAADALDAMRQFAREEGALADAIAGVVVLFAPCCSNMGTEEQSGGGRRDDGSSRHGGGSGGSGCSSGARVADELRGCGRGHDEVCRCAEGLTGGRADVQLQPLPHAVLAELQGYGQLPIPKRAVLYHAVYTAFLRGTDELADGALVGAFPPWEATRFAAEVLGPRVEALKLRQKPCVFFKLNRCHFGETCRFSHAEPQSVGHGMPHGSAGGAASFSCGSPSDAVYKAGEENGGGISSC